MVVQCSEDAKAALNHIAFRKKAEVHLSTPLRPFGPCSFAQSKFSCHGNAPLSP